MLDFKKKCTDATFSLLILSPHLRLNEPNGDSGNITFYNDIDKETVFIVDGDIWPISELMLIIGLLHLYFFFFTIFVQFGFVNLLKV